MKSDELSSYLEANVAEGQLDSRGQFTIAVSELLRKLSTHSLYHWANWIVFAVRAMVRAGCSSLRLNQKKQ